MTRQRFLSVSGLLAAVLLLQWAVGLAGCVASLSARASLPLAICHADSTNAVPSGPTGHELGGDACPVSVQLAATLLPDPPVTVPIPPGAYTASTPLHARAGWTPGRASPAHPARGPPVTS